MEATGGGSVLNAYHLSCNLFEGFWLQDVRLKRFRVQDLELKGTRFWPLKVFRISMPKSVGPAQFV